MQRLKFTYLSSLEVDFPKVFAWARRLVDDLNKWADLVLAKIESLGEEIGLVAADVDLLEVDLLAVQDDIDDIKTDILDLENDVLGLEDNVGDINAALALVVPVGSRILWYSQPPPTGWLAADGQSLLVANYPALFAVTGYTYGGAGANFNVIDDFTLFGLTTIIKY